jgi:hypothetical protein
MYNSDQKKIFKKKKNNLPKTQKLRKMIHRSRSKDERKTKTVLCRGYGAQNPEGQLVAKSSPSQHAMLPRSTA